MKTVVDLITCYRVQVAILSVIAAALVLFGVPPDKQAEAKDLVIGIFTLAGAVIAAHGYAEGQSSSTPLPPANPINFHLGSVEAPSPESTGSSQAASVAGDAQKPS